MNRTSTQTHTSRTYTHRLKSKIAMSKEVLIITSYDYFLDKKGLVYLLKRYSEIILVPRTVDDDYLLNQTVRPLLVDYSKIHLIVNPIYDEKYHIVYDLIAHNNKTIRITTVFDFCEKYLHKIYIPHSVLEENPTMPVKPQFNYQVRIAKQCIDFIFSALLILFSFPVWLLSIVKIKRESPGPVFYHQERVGLKEQPFGCIKFRSMGLDAEANGAAFSRKRDTRVFEYGAFMRTTRIDELPQLLNIFRGQLSLVGPRPERPVFTQTFEELIPYYNLRHNVKPGLTGYAQVMYSYGAGVYDARHKLMYDLYYIKNWSLALEIKIIFLTTFVIINRMGR
ncbi:sugar transferase [Telluribacter humicola]|uniref:sugar transferase n=1 Tax=Telluribacter humicola TaxID=1720261 RepID=UPI001A96EA6C|nr:sugar transferase [Telluribacter humicola]